MPKYMGNGVARFLEESPVGRSFPAKEDFPGEVMESLPKGRGLGGRGEGEDIVSPLARRESLNTYLNLVRHVVCPQLGNPRFLFFRGERLSIHPLPGKHKPNKD